MKLSTFFNKERRERREKEFAEAIKRIKENPAQIKRVGNYISITKGITATEEGNRLIYRKNGKVIADFGGSSISQGFSNPLTGEDKAYLACLL